MALPDRSPPHLGKPHRASGHATGHPAGAAARGDGRSCGIGWWLLGIAAAALLIRLIGIRYGLPFKLVDDEWIEVRRAMLLGTGVEQTEPFRLFKALLYLVLFVEYGVFYVIGRIGGLFLSSEDLGVLYLSDPTLLYLIGRVTSAVMGAATVWLTGRLGLRLFGRGTGLLAAAALALAPLHAEFSHYIRVDVLLTLLTTAGLLAALSLQSRPGTRRALGCGILLALAALAKVTGALLVVPMAVAILWAPGRLSARIRRGLILAGVAAGLYLLANRHIVTEIGRAAGLVQDVVGPTGEGGDRFLVQTPDRPATNLAYYLRALWPSYGPLPFLAALGGLLVAFVATRRGRGSAAETTTEGTGTTASDRRDVLSPADRRPGHLLAWLLVAAWAGVLLGPGNMVNKTYLMPAEPVVWVYAAIAIVQVARRRRRLAVLLGAALLAWPAAATGLVEVRLLSTDTRIEAREWIQARWPAGTPVFIDSIIDGPALDDEPENRIARFRGPRTDRLGEQAALQERLARRIHPDRPYHFIYDPNFLRRGATLDEVLSDGARVITTNGRYRDAILGIRGRDRFPEAAAFYETLESSPRVRLLKSFSPRRILLLGLEMAVQAGPEIRVYAARPPDRDERDGR